MLVKVNDEACSRPTSREDLWYTLTRLTSGEVWGVTRIRLDAGDRAGEHRVKVL
jgi:hypothetical protein